MIYARYPRILVWGLILLTISVIHAGCARRETEAVVTSRDIIAYLPLEGEIAVPPASEANIAAPYDAPVERVYVTVGQAVRRGEVIVQLSAPESQAYYQQSRQRLIQARDQLAQAQRTYGAEVRDSEQELAQARQAERQARQVAQAQPGVSAQISITETTSTDLARAIERRQAAEQAVIDARARYESQIAPYRQQLAYAEQRFQEAQQGRKAASVRTPIAGTVLEVNARSGDTVGPDERRPIARIVDLDALKIYSSVNEEQAAEIEPNDPAIVTVRDIPGEEFPGSVQQVYSERAGFLRGAQFVAVVDFVNRRGQAKPDMRATASVKVGEARDVLSVPASAVYEMDSGYAVRVRRDDDWREREVETGLSDGRYTEIRSGLNEGDIVLANP